MIRMSKENSGIAEQMSFSISYQNIHGFTAGGSYANSMEYIKTILQESPIFILAETWFQSHEKYTKEETFVLSTSKPIFQKRNKLYHHLNGLAIFANPAAKAKIKIINTHTYFIKFSYGQILLAGIYFPPSLDEDTISQCLQQIGRVDLIMGDFNVRLDRELSSNKKQKIIEYTTQHHLYYQSLESSRIKSNKWDHVYANDLLQDSEAYYLDNTTLRSDHGRILFKGNLSKQHSLETRGTDNIRYKMYNLKYPKYVSKFMTTYDQLSANSKHMIPSVEAPAYIGHLWINKMNKIIVENINRTCKKVLGIQKNTTYQSLQEDPLIKKLQKSCKNDDILRIWKRLSKRSKRLRGNLSLDDGKQHFQQLYEYKDSNERRKFEINRQDEEKYSNFEYRNLSDGLIFKVDADKIKNVIEKYSNSKSGGPDGIHIKMLKILIGSSSFIQDITMLFNRIIFYGYTPESWNISNIVCIPKKVNEPISINNARGISLTQMLRRIFECVFHSTIMKMGENSYFKTSPNQTGFKKKTNTYPNLLLINDQHLYGRKYKVFIDLKAAYDRVSIKKLLNILETRNTPKRIISLIYHLFHQCDSNVIIDQEKSETFRRERGLFQGSILSPLLFNIYIDDLATIFDKILEKTTNLTVNYQNVERKSIARVSGFFACSSCEETFPSKRGFTQHLKTPCHHNDTSFLPFYLFYADDIEINAADPILIQKFLDALDKWCEEYNMMPGLKKCQWIAPPNDTITKLSLQNENLERVSSYKYLGLDVTFDGIEMLNFLNQCLTRTKKKFGQLRSYEQYLSCYQRITLVKSEIISQLEYGSPLISIWMKAQNYQKYDQAQHLIREIDTIVESARTWASQSRLKLAQFLTNINNISTMLTMREGALNQQLDRLPEDNPIKIVYARKNETPDRIKDQAMIFRAFESKLYAEYQAKQESKGRFQDYLYNLKTQEYNHISCVLYTKAPTQKGKVDAVFRIKSEQILRKALLWRKRKMPYCMEKDPNQNQTKILKSICTHCQVDFKEEHINHCPLVRDHPLVSNYEEQRRFQEAKKYLIKSFPQAAKFTILDYWLNSKQSGKFDTLFSIIESNLTRIFRESN